MRLVRCAGPACIASLLGMPVALADTLAVKTGLWEITSITQSSGVAPLPAEVLAKLSPEQQTRMRAQMLADQDKPVTDVSRECITQQDIEKPVWTADAERCRQTLVATSGTRQQVTLTCEGEPKGTGSIVVDAPDPETMHGVFDMKLGGGADAFNIKAQMSGRWLGNDCGEEGEDEGVDGDEDEDEDADGDS